MPPDLNSFPPSPRPTNPPSETTSRRTSQMLGQRHSPHSNIHAEGGVPVRHPRPMTPAELHHELEREQESIVRPPSIDHTPSQHPHLRSVSELLAVAPVSPVRVRELHDMVWLSISIAGCQVPSRRRRLRDWLRNVVHAVFCVPPCVLTPDNCSDPMQQQIILGQLLEIMESWIHASRPFLTSHQVNRLTRELAQLRAQSASALSNHSNSSASSSAVHDPAIDGQSLPVSATQPYFPLTGPTHPTPSRARRSSSNVSHRSSASQSAMLPPAAPVGSTSQASVDRARDAVGSITSPLQRSRQNSTVLPPPASHRPTSAAPSPSPSPGLRNTHVFVGENAAYFPPPTHAAARPPSMSLSSSASSLHRIQSPAPGPRDAQDAAAVRQQLEQVKGDNERLVRRVKELEKEIRRMKRSSEVGPSS